MCNKRKSGMRARTRTEMRAKEIDKLDVSRPIILRFHFLSLFLFSFDQVNLWLLKTGRKLSTHLCNTNRRNQIYRHIAKNLGYEN